MAEAFGIVSSVISIGDVAARLGLRIGRFLQDASEVDSSLKDLMLKKETLKGILETVGRTLKSRGRELQGLSKPVNEDELDIIWKLKNSLQHCEKTVHSFEAMLNVLGPSDQSLSRRGRWALQLKLDLKEAAIAKLEKSVDTDVLSLQTYSMLLMPYVFSYTRSRSKMF